MRRRERIKTNFMEACKHRSVPMQFFDIIKHKLRVNTHWEDYYRFAFYRSDISWETKSRYVGSKGSKYWPWEGNSLKYDRLFLHKSLQKSVLIANGLPTPPLLLRVGLDYPINSADLFRKAMADFDQPVMTKFDGGGSGVGIYSLTPEAGGFRCGNQIVDSDWIWARYEAAMERGFLVEETVRNHPDLEAVNSDALNTLRLTTTKTANGKWHILLPHIKFGRSGSHVDNLGAGGMFAEVDHSGTVIGRGHSKKTGEYFDSHPDSGVVLKGFQVPYYEEACELALNASATFGFMASIAWDVGITPNGPVIIEGNPAWDSDAIQDRLGPYLSKEVAAGLSPRHWFTPWDKTHMYPQYMEDVHGGFIQKYMDRRRKRWKENFQKQMTKPGVD